MCRLAVKEVFGSSVDYVILKKFKIILTTAMSMSVRKIPWSIIRGRSLPSTISRLTDKDLSKGWLFIRRKIRIIHKNSLHDGQTL